MRKILNNRYEIIKQIGSGAMGVVYLAYCSTLKRDVAIKELINKEDTDKKNLTIEAKACARLSHGNIVQVYDVFEEEDNTYIVMEYLSGHNLKKILDVQGKKAMSIEKAIEMTMKLALALSSAHQRGVIHRDIKSENIIVDEFNEPKIMDFGIASIKHEERLKKDIEAAGTLRYSSPEQLQGDFVDERTDIYSLGLLLFELLTGKLPFSSDKPLRAAIRRINEELPKPSELNPDIDQKLDEIFLKATSKFPEDRYLNMQEFYNDLKSYISFKNLEDNSNYNLKNSKNKDEKLKDVNKNSIIPILLGIALALISIFIISLPFLFEKEKEAVTKVPNVINLKYEEAFKILNEKKLNTIINKSVYSKEFAKGKVVEQSIKDGETVKEGTDITLVVSKGEESIKMKNLIGMNIEQAKSTIEELGLRLSKLEEKATSDYEKDIVISQSIEKDEPIKKGMNIDLIISKEKEEMVIMPNLVSLDLTEATKIINGIGLKLEIKQEYSETVELNNIIRQSVSKGQKIKKDTKILIVISKGKKEELIDDKRIDYAFVFDTNNFNIPLEKYIVRIVIVNGDEREEIYKKEHSKSDGKVSKTLKVNSGDFYEIYADEFKVGEGIVN